jgi:hypothetical protein
MWVHVYPGWKKVSPRPAGIHAFDSELDMEFE